MVRLKMNVQVGTIPIESQVQIQWQKGAGGVGVTGVTLLFSPFVPKCLRLDIGKSMERFIGEIADDRTLNQMYQHCLNLLRASTFYAPAGVTGKGDHGP